jgi:hypothetical protein
MPPNMLMRVRVDSDGSLLKTTIDGRELGDKYTLSMDSTIPLYSGVIDITIPKVLTE